MNLFKALSYKEWMKTRKFILVAFVLLAAVAVYSYIDITYAIRIEEAVNIWYGFIFQGVSVSNLMMYLIPLSGISMAIVQFVPEMTNKRFKLTLHLPASETRLVSAMLLYGHGVLFALYFVCIVFMSVIIGLVMPEGIAVRALDYCRTCRIWIYGMDMRRTKLEAENIQYADFSRTVVCTVRLCLS